MKLPPGFTLVQLIVCVAILAVLLAMVVPAVQSVRESARRLECQNNLRQMGLALQNHHAAEGALPSFYNGSALAYPLREWDLFHMHSWQVMLLPQLEQAALLEQADLGALASEPENAAVAQAIVPTFICPSGGDPSRMGWGIKHDGVRDPPNEIRPEDRYHVVRSDYDAMAGIQSLPDPLSAGADAQSVDFIHWGIWGWPVFDTKQTTGARLLRYRRGQYRDVTDGLSHTLALVERGGKPIELQHGKPIVYPGNPYPDYPGQVGWSVSNTFTWSMNWDGVGVNQWNSRGIYALHPEGANVAIADGSVRFLPETTSFQVLVSLYGRSDGGLPE